MTSSAFTVLNMFGWKPPPRGGLRPGRSGPCWGVGWAVGRSGHSGGLEGLELGEVLEALDGAVAEAGLEVLFGGPADAGVEEGPEGLLDELQVLEGVADEGVPTGSVGAPVVGTDRAAAVVAATAAPEGAFEVEDAVFVGEFLVGLDVADGDFESVAGADGIEVAAVVDVFGEVPADDAGAGGVDVGILLDHGPGMAVHGLVTFRGNLDLEGVLGVGDGTFGDEGGGEDAAADDVVDPAEAGIWMDHCFSSSRRSPRAGRGDRIASRQSHPACSGGSDGSAPMRVNKGVPDKVAN